MIPQLILNNHIPDNTACFANSIVQVLRNVPSVLEMKYIQDGQTGALLPSIFNMLGSDQVSTIKDLRECVGVHCNELKFHRGSEENACEFLTCLLQSHQLLNKEADVTNAYF